MAKQQEFIELFAKYDEDKDGQVSQQQFINIITELEIPYQYPGTVAKIIRRLNYADPNRNTLNLEQAKQYYNSFESISKHELWKTRIGILNKAVQIKNQMNEPKEQSGAAPGAAAPGMATPTQQPEKYPQKARINILIGQAQPVYMSEVDVQFDKIAESQKVKPFGKLTLTSKTQERAKSLETIFKECLNTFLSILSEEVPDYADVIKEIHVNSMVVGTKTTFFVTTTNEQLIQLIQMASEFFELTFDLPLDTHLHLKFEFDYDFERFINEENSNFYDIFTRNCRLSLDVTLLNLMKSMRRLFKSQLKQSPMDKFQALTIASLLYIEGVEGDFEFENSEITVYEKETKEQIKELLGEWRSFFHKLVGAGMKLQELIQLLDDTITIQAKAGEWKANVFLRLNNFNKIFLYQPVSADSDDGVQVNTIAILGKSSSQGSFKNSQGEVAKHVVGSDSELSQNSVDSKKKKVKKCSTPPLKQNLSQESD